ncbi:MAG: hypothetical protein GF418_13980 [Chitinivibrionales bacterium]|nr:hypothetical protein [Chitinivibrionales bacterium]MBD3396727.1 hypothetical protein [Chitinivibrionales bacterium]
MRLQTTIVAAAVLLVIVPARAQTDFPALDITPDTTVARVDTTTDSLPAASELDQDKQRGPQKLKLIRRTYNYRQQLGLALAMMGFVAIIFTSVQNWNPD